MGLQTQQENELFFSDTINKLARKGTDYWSFKGNSKRSIAHALIQYPAMMVPQMQGELIDTIISCNPNIKSILDPFVGSGTTLSETMMRGLDFGGFDINPLAILACKTKSGPFYANALEEKIKSLMQAIKEDKSRKKDHSFNKVDKWFEPKVQIDLCKIRRNIKKESSLWARRFFWLALCDTVRKSCNSRPTTYKLHIKAEEDIKDIQPPIPYFIKKIQSNLLHIKEQKKALDKAGFLNRARYDGDINLTLSDIRKTGNDTEKYDLLISSPPYGDNGTTVTYGQYSYLPLNWIDVDDIKEDIPEEYISVSTGIDSSSLGGSKKDVSGKLERIKNVSDSFYRSYKEIPEDSKTGRERLVSFVHDIDEALEVIIQKLNNKACMVWTLGNRRIADKEIPLNAIFREILESKGCDFLREIKREIPSKRMPARNKTSNTMNQETILIMRK